MIAFVLQYSALEVQHCTWELLFLVRQKPLKLVHGKRPRGIDERIQPRAQP